MTGAGPDQNHNEAVSHRLQDVLPKHRPDLPENIEWSAHVDYNCRVRHCQDSCFNRVDSPYAQKKVCRACYSKVDLDGLPPKCLHLPDWGRGLVVDDTTATSEGKGETESPEAQRSEHPGTGRERQSRAAQSRQTGSVPLRDDPEARAHTPNPQGEGSPKNDTHQSESGDTPTGRSP